MKAIAIMNNKGGVGKTVTAINLADILANDYKQRVVLVDCDGQANLTGFFLPGIEADVTTTGDILTGDCEQVWSDNLIPLRHNIQLLPSSSGLYDLDLQAIKDGASAPERLRGFVDAAREDGDTDWMIFDCPPGYTVSSVAALLAATESWGASKVVLGIVQNESGYPPPNPCFCVSWQSAMDDSRTDGDDHALNAVAGTAGGEMMDAVEFLDKVDRLSKRGSTEEKMRYNDYRTAGDNTWAVKFVERWTAEHPIKTRQSVFLEMFPNAPIFPDTGIVKISPCEVDAVLRGNCPGVGCCPECRKKFWLAEVE